MKSSSDSSSPDSDSSAQFEQLSFIAGCRSRFQHEVHSKAVVIVSTSAFVSKPGEGRSKSTSNFASLDDRVTATMITEQSTAGYPVNLVDSRPVSVASLHDDIDDDQYVATTSPSHELNNSDHYRKKEEKFYGIHKPVLHLKSVPSPAETPLRNRVRSCDREIDAANLMDKLTVLDKIINDMSENSEQYHSSDKNIDLDPVGGVSDAFADSESEIHCNPVFVGPNSSIDRTKGTTEKTNKDHDSNIEKSVGKKLKKKRQKKSSVSGSDDD